MAQIYNYTVQDSTVTIKDSLGNQITQFNIASETNQDKIIQDSVLTIKDSNNSVITVINLKPEEVSSFQVNDSVITITDLDNNVLNIVNVPATDNQTIQVNVSGGGVCPNIIHGFFNEGYNTMPNLIIPFELAGTYSCVDNHNNGTLTFKVNNSVETLPFVLLENDILDVERSDDSVDGWFKLKTDCLS